MGYKDDVKFGLDSKGNLTMTAIDYKDHKGLGPHAHDVDMSKPVSDFNSARGEARPLTEVERIEYLDNTQTFNTETGKGETFDSGLNESWNNGTDNTLNDGMGDGMDNGMGDGMDGGME